MISTPATVMESSWISFRTTGTNSRPNKPTQVLRLLLANPNLKCFEKGPLNLSGPFHSHSDEGISGILLSMSKGHDHADPDVDVVLRTIQLSKAVHLFKTLITRDLGLVS